MKFKHQNNCTVGLDVYKSHCRQIAGNRSSRLHSVRQKVPHEVQHSSLACTVGDAPVLMAEWTPSRPPYGPVPSSLSSTASALQTWARRRASRWGGSTRWRSLRKRREGTGGGGRGWGHRWHRGRGRYVKVGWRQSPIWRAVRGRRDGRRGGGGGGRRCWR